MKRIILLIILLLALSFSVQASIVAKVSMKGLSFVDPKLASAVGNVMALSDPTSFVEGKIIGSVKSETIGKIQEGIIQEFGSENPEAMNSINTWNKVKGYIDQGSEIVNELELNEKGEIEKGVIKFNKLSKVGGLINKDMKDEDIQISNGNLDIKTVPYDIKATTGEKIKTIETKSYIVTLNDGGSLNIKGNLYMNIEEGAKFRLNSNGDLVGAQFKSKGGEYYFGDRKIRVPVGSIVNFENGNIDVSGVNKFDFGVGKEGIYNEVDILEGGSLSILNDNSLKGKNFKIGDIKVNNGYIRIDKENYFIGASTEVDVNNVIFRNDEELGSIPLYLNKNPEGDKYVHIDEKSKYLNVKGRFFDVKLKPGNKFIDVHQDNYLEINTLKGEIELSGGINPKLKISGFDTTIINGNSEFNIVDLKEGSNLYLNTVNDRYTNIPLEVVLPDKFDSKIILDKDKFFLSPVNVDRSDIIYNDYSSRDIKGDIKVLSSSKNCFATDVIFSSNKILNGCFSKEDTSKVSKLIDGLPDEYKDTLNYIKITNNKELRKICDIGFGASVGGCVLGDGRMFFNDKLVKNPEIFIHELAHLKHEEKSLMDREIFGLSEKLGYSEVAEMFRNNFDKQWYNVVGGDEAYGKFKGKFVQAIRPPFGYNMIPVDGFCDSYGSFDIFEDVAECVRLAYQSPDKFASILNKDKRYEQKLNLLCNYAFIPEDRCVEIKMGGKK